MHKIFQISFLAAIGSTQNIVLDEAHQTRVTDVKEELQDLIGELDYSIEMASWTDNEGETEQALEDEKEGLINVLDLDYADASKTFRIRHRATNLYWALSKNDEVWMRSSQILELRFVPMRDYIGWGAIQVMSNCRQNGLRNGKFQVMSNGCRSEMKFIMTHKNKEKVPIKIKKGYFHTSMLYRFELSKGLIRHHDGNTFTVPAGLNPKENQRIDLWRGDKKPGVHTWDPVDILGNYVIVGVDGPPKGQWVYTKCFMNPMHSGREDHWSYTGMKQSTQEHFDVSMQVEAQFGFSMFSSQMKLSTNYSFDKQSTFESKKSVSKTFQYTKGQSICYWQYQFYGKYLGRDITFNSDIFGNSSGPARPPADPFR